MKQTRTASEVVAHNTEEYGKHILSNHFPSVIDGLKKVKRRIIYAQDTKKSFSGSELVSKAIKLHPYGDTSIYDTATKMCDTFRSGFPLLELIGNPGSYSGDKAAHSRYTKFRISPFCKDIFINGVDSKTFPMMVTEDLTDYEPKYFIPKLPTALLFANESVGFGYKSFTLPIKFEFVCDLVMDFAMCKNKTTWDFTKHASKFIPLLPVKVAIKNKAALVSAYKKGNFSEGILTEGVVELCSQSSILIRTIGYGQSTTAIRESLTKSLKDRNNPLAKLETLAEDVNHVDFRLTFEKTANIFAVINKLKKSAKLEAAVWPFNNFVYDDKLVPVPPPDLIKWWYKERYRSILGGKKHEQQLLQRRLLTLDTYLIICEHVDEVVDVIKKNDKEGIFKYLHDKFDLSLYQCDILISAQIITLSKFKKTELEQQMVELKEKITTLIDSFGKIDQEIHDDAQKLKNKYHTNMVSTSFETSYFGSLIIDQCGIIRFTTPAELYKLSGMFKKHKQRVVLHSVPVNEIKVYGVASRIPNTYNSVAELPYTSHAAAMSVSRKGAPNHVALYDDRIKIVDRYSADQVITVSVSDNPYCCTSKGIRRISIKKLDDLRGRKTNIKYLFDAIPNVDKYLVVSVNSEQPNVIRFQKVTLATKKLLFSGAGKTEIISVLQENTASALINCSKYQKYNFIFLENLKKLLKHDLNDIQLRNFKHKY